ncbi:membrane-bound lytic murein transglycosylase B [Aliiroseovarius halocynthiae]|uniref:lytic murein transglycosylase n=1 Tax=Aliiroseovarius halocynthiae TaxID=985055 RepID=UPI001FE7D878|nr:lytic murein transglycosylase [Aliiroseovarius halocynthiae]SMR82353.1 membrane-bound lytic murein transglycosylase B [Aliiroseovarius halocynthiae]
MTQTHVNAGAGFDQWLDGYIERASKNGVTRELLQQAMPFLVPEPGIHEKQSNQSEFALNITQYLDRVVTLDRVSKGRAKFRDQRKILNEIAGTYRVDPQVLLAIWGVETDYGRVRGAYSVLTALANLAHDGHRAAFFEDELSAALSIIENRHARAEDLVGSWAGAMGHGQFIPTSFLKFAVDHDKDGKCDIWSNDPIDGLASIANYLTQHDWRESQPWGIEAQLPDDFDFSMTGPEQRMRIADLNAMGVRSADDSNLPDYGAASVLCPSGATGPAFVVNHNFHVILTYNRAEAYGIAVGHLSDRLAGLRAKVSRCPDGLTPLTRNQMSEFQTLLTKAGFDTQGADGFTGPNTRKALRAYQNDAGLVPDGFATAALLDGLRQSV